MQVLLTHTEMTNPHSLRMQNNNKPNCATELVCHIHL